MESIVNALLPIFVELLVGVLAVVAVAAYAKFAKWANVATGVKFRDLEARHREALHKALETGVYAAIELRDPDAILREAMKHAERSVPDAVEFFTPSLEVWKKMTLAKVHQRLGVND